eukprot:CAMPEP_0118916368 /NCGR_PEP_ID=MMETSP1166-20130328/16370_1 /TAXON_ID=1104430 /ORGANISM="Chrysoreinhardia sp, Strain CCMP3193" /LENGTH=35 /DNA_ID= /DNA_START= /DNA_END= /DNA_ORIENTATION=
MTDDGSGREGGSPLAKPRGAGTTLFSMKLPSLFSS